MLRSRLLHMGTQQLFPLEDPEASPGHPLTAVPPQGDLDVPLVRKKKEEGSSAKLHTECPRLTPPAGRWDDHFFLQPFPSLPLPHRSRVQAQGVR